MKLSELKKLIGEEYLPQVISNEFGGFDDKAFLKKVWGMTIEELTVVLEKAKSDLKWLNGMGRNKGVMYLFYKKDAQWVKVRVKWLEDIIKKKTKEPAYTPDMVKESVKLFEIKKLVKECIVEVLSKEEQNQFVDIEPCKTCGKGQYGGAFYVSCDNPKCPKYDDFVMSKCGKCGALRRDCCC